jgi:hypothetical protein
LYSQGKSSIVAVKPADRTFSTSNDLAFQVVITNAGAQPFEVSPSNVFIRFMRSGEATTYAALDFDGYTKLKNEQQAGGGTYALAMLGMAAGAAFSGYGGSIGDSSMMSSGNSLTNDTSAFLDQSAGHDKGISDQVSAADEVYLHRTTLNPGQTQSGMIYFPEFEASDGGLVVVEISLPGDTHRVTFALAENQ